ncbi:hypothetical protein ACJX0J_024209, partial [Zea mays]
TIITGVAQPVGHAMFGGKNTELGVQEFRPNSVKAREEIIYCFLLPNNFIVIWDVDFDQGLVSTGLVLMVPIDVTSLYNHLLKREIPPCSLGWHKMTPFGIAKKDIISCNLEGWKSPIFLKPNAQWDLSAARIFNEICVEQIQGLNFRDMQQEIAEMMESYRDLVICIHYCYLFMFYIIHVETGYQWNEKLTLAADIIKPKDPTFAVESIILLIQVKGTTNIIERSFGVLKMKWRILLNKQKKIIIACMADEDFDRIASDETYVDGYMGASTSDLVDEEDMGGVRDAIAQALMENA